MNTRKTAETSLAPLSADDLLCTNAREWLKARGWRGGCRLIIEPACADTSVGHQRVQWLRPQWQFELDSTPTGRVSLWLEFPAGATPDLAECALMQSYLRAALWMAKGRFSDDAVPPRGELVLAARADVEKQLHDIGNRLNSLIANAAVLAVASREDARMEVFAIRAAKEGEACATLLSQLSKTLLEMRS